MSRAEVELLDAADPSPAAAAAAREVDERLKANVRRLRGMWVEIARDLHQFHQARLWHDLGYATFEVWLQDPDLDLERRWVYDAIAMYHQLVIERGIDPSRLQEMHISKVREIMPAIRREQVDVEEALADAETLRRVDLEQKYRGAASDGRTAGPDTSSEIRTASEPVWRRCPHCGQMYQTTPAE